MLRRMLERLGHEVMEAENGARGVALLRASTPHVVLLDLLMPEQDGIETIQQLRAEFPDTPVVAMSGGGSAKEGGLLADADLFGADATLSKPFSRGELLATMERVLVGRA